MSGIISTERWERDCNSLDDQYSGARWVPVPGSPTTGYWRIPISISPPAKEIESVLEDLIAERCIEFEQSGRIRHLLKCEISHSSSHEHIVRHFQNISGKYEVRAAYKGQLADPSIWIADTTWSRQALDRHAHLNPDGSSCVLFPPSNAWNPLRDTLAMFVDQTVLWVFKSECWIANGAQSNGRGWPGPGQSHSVVALLKSSWHARCQCGSGKKFGRCCRPGLIKKLVERQIPYHPIEFDGSIRDTALLMRINPRWHLNLQPNNERS